MKLDKRNNKIYNTFEEFSEYNKFGIPSKDDLEKIYNSLTDVFEYDSKADTLEHIKKVNEYLIDASMRLLRRAQVHDESKLGLIEKPLFDEMTPLLKNLTYGSQEYKDSLLRLKPALDAHYASNTHHPEHYKNGIDGMSLFDVIEMFFDWKAAGERNKDGSLEKSIEINKDRFKMSEQLVNIFKNTI